MLVQVTEVKCTHISRNTGITWVWLLGIILFRPNREVLWSLCSQKSENFLKLLKPKRFLKVFGVFFPFFFIEVIHYEWYILYRWNLWSSCEDATAIAALPRDSKGSDGRVRAEKNSGWMSWIFLLAWSPGKVAGVIEQRGTRENNCCFKQASRIRRPHCRALPLQVTVSTTLLLHQHSSSQSTFL